MSNDFPQKIVGWTRYDDPDHEELFPIGEPVPWEWHDEIEEMIVTEIRSKGYKFSGFYHQGGEYGCPLFDNGKWYGTTFRSWGWIMAMAYPDSVHLPEESSYVEWAWTPPEEEVYPNPDDYKASHHTNFKPVTKQLLDEIFQFDTWPWYQKLHYYILSFFGKIEVAWYTHVMMPIWQRKENRSVKHAAHDNIRDDEES